MPSSGGAGGACFIIAPRTMAADRDNRPGAGLPLRLAPQRARRARGRRLRRDRARARVRHARLRLRRGRHPRPRPRLQRGVRGAHRPLRGRLREQGVPVHRDLPAAGRGGPVVRRGLGRRAAPGAGRRLRARAHLHARQQQDRGRAAPTRSSAAWAPSSPTPSTRSSACARLAPGQQGDAAGHARHQARRPTTTSQTGQVDSKFGFGLDDVPRAIEACQAAGLALRGLHAHIGSQIFELSVLRAARRGAGRDGRLPAAQPRRRPGHRLHRRGPAAVGRRVRRGAAVPARPRA